MVGGFRRLTSNNASACAEQIARDKHRPRCHVFRHSSRKVVHDRCTQCAETGCAGGALSHPRPHQGLSLFLRYLPPAEQTGRVVLYVHGGTFASGVSIAQRFDGRSWRDELCAAGFHVWGLDFHGFGRWSDRYPEMADRTDRHAPLGRAADASRQLEQAGQFHLQPSWGRPDLADRPFLGQHRRRTLCRALSGAGGPIGIFRPDRPARAQRGSGASAGMATDLVCRTNEPFHCGRSFG